jgi:hypothetical protein
MVSEPVHAMLQGGSPRGEVLREGFSRRPSSRDYETRRARSLLFAHTLTRYSGLRATLTQPPNS